MQPGEDCYVSSSCFFFVLVASHRNVRTATYSKGQFQCFVKSSECLETMSFQAPKVKSKPGSYRAQIWSSDQNNNMMVTAVET